jgi:hypothetical protein
VNTAPTLDPDDLRNRATLALGGLGYVAVHGDVLLSLLDSRDEALESLKHAELDLDESRAEVSALERDFGEVEAECERLTRLLEGCGE